MRLVAFVCDEMNAQIETPLIVQVDNKQAITFKEGTCMTSKIRGVVDMREQWVRELRQAKGVDIKYVPAEGQKADMLTKGLPNYKFRLALRQLRGDRHRRHMLEVVALAHRGGA